MLACRVIWFRFMKKAPLLFKEGVGGGSESFYQVFEL
jgi:hypothetical protein